ncbi:peroxidase family protein [Sagittula sp.]|uniref:peroxidase family protein n=1 Tax=Sagittula sp. TaxID=2038081 RepID=UPI00351376B2
MKDLDQNLKATCCAPGHGATGFRDIVKLACDNQRTGTCNGAEPQEGTAEFVFGRMVDMMPLDQQPSKEGCEALAAVMLDDEAGAEDGPADAGIAFLGQFIDHDITLDATTKLGEVAGAVTKIRNFRTPALDLDCVYGNGPEVNPWLYESDNRLIFGRGPTERTGPDENPLDLQRNVNGRALIGDPRNDENLFVSQVHGRMFVTGHNNNMERLSDISDAEDRLHEARAELTWEYHDRILHQFLPAVIHEDVLTPMLAQAHNMHLEDIGRLSWANAPAMPVEFSAAAFRFGHSLIRETYKLNDNPDRAEVRIFAREADAVKLDGFAPVEKDNNLDMALFFGPGAQKSRPIDTRLPAALLNLPDSVATSDKNLAARNMIRGHLTFKLPTGEKMAEWMEAPLIDTHDKVKDAGLEGRTPLWFYMLAEAEQHGGKLGPVGGGIVAGVLLNMLIRAHSPALRPYRGV